MPDQWSSTRELEFFSKLEHLREKDTNEARDEFNMFINPSQKGNHVPFSTQLKYIVEKFKLFKDEKDECTKIFDGQKDLVKSMHGYALGYLRHLRAFNFNESCSLADRIFDFLDLLLKDDYESLTKLDKLEKAFESAVVHLEIKAEQDP